jgi:large subunit ribosomal protein L35Ae
MEPTRAAKHPLTHTFLPPPPPSPSPGRHKRNQDNNTVLVKVEGVQDKKASNFYAGKRVVYIYKTAKKAHGTKFRTLWGRLGNPHGANGVLKAKFSSNLPPKALGEQVRVMLFPSRI